MSGTFSPLERTILRSCHLNEWHPTAWFPDVKRESLNLPDGPSDSDIQNCLIHLIRAGVIEVGKFPDTQFVPEPVISEAMIEDIKNNEDTEFFFRTPDDVYQKIRNIH